MEEEPKNSVTDLLEKDIIRQAIKEWMDDQFASFGRWSFYGILAMAMSAIFWLIFSGITAQIKLHIS